MIERVFQITSAYVQPRAAGVRRRMAGLHLGWCVVAVVVILVGGRLAWVRATASVTTLKEVGRAFGSIGILYGQPQADSAGKRVTYVQQGEKALSVCLSEVATKTREVIYEEYDPWVRILRVWPWSPDDRHFVYTKTEKLVIYEAAMGRSTEVGIDKDTVTDLVWLTKDELVYVNGGNSLRWVKRQSDGQWQLFHPVQPSYAQGTITSLNAIGTNSVAWLQDNQVWRMNLILPETNSVMAAAAQLAAGPVKEHLVLWLDASTVQQKDGGAVNWLVDLSPKQNHAVAERITPPTFNGPESPGALNGKGTLRFVSADPATNSAGLRTRQVLPLTGAAPRSVFVVMRRAGDRQMLINMGTTGTNATYFGICDQNDFAYLPAGWATHDNRLSKMPPNEWRIWETVYDGETAAGFVNGGLKGARKFTLNTGAKELEIGIRSPNGEGRLARGSDGDFAELLVYETALSEAQRQRVRDYLNAKWFAGKLPLHDSGREATVWYDPKRDGWSEFVYARETGAALLSRSENGFATLWRMTPEKTDPPAPVLRAAAIQNLRWVGSNQCAFTTRRTEISSSLMLANVNDGNVTRFFESGNVSRFASVQSADAIFVAGTVGAEVSDGIWRLDLVSGAVTNVVSYTENPNALAKRIEELHGTLTTTNGRRLDYYVYPPAEVKSGSGKYPLLIGNTLFVNGDPLYQGKSYGPLWVQALANAGAYVAVVDRSTWYGGIEQWEENVLCLYQGLIQNPNVDRQRVFLFAASAETQYLGKLIARHPDLWNGVILINPGSLPDLKQFAPTKAVPKCLITLGALEGRNSQLARFKTEAINHGMAVEYISHAGATHWLQAKPAVRDRTDAILNFVLEN